MWAGQPLKSSCNARAPSFSQIHTQVFLGRLVMQVEIACVEVGQYECGQKEGHVGRLISQANIRFAYLDRQCRGRVLQEILKWHTSH